MNSVLNYKGRKIVIKDIKKCNELEKFVGLMFSRWKKAKALLFDFKKPTKMAIHSWFVFFPFWAIWLNDKHEILDKRIIKPFTFCISPKEPFSKLIEIPFNKEYKRIIGLLVGD